MTHCTTQSSRVNVNLLQAAHYKLMHIKFIAKPLANQLITYKPVYVPPLARLWDDAPKEQHTKNHSPWHSLFSHVTKMLRAVD